MGERTTRVRRHTRTLRSGRTVTVRAHLRRLPPGAAAAGAGGLGLLVLAIGAFAVLGGLFADDPVPAPVSTVPAQVNHAPAPEPSVEPPPPEPVTEPPPPEPT
ncbi:hypothetical protein HS048_36450 [Planomonospora sp. ID91781]|uniref:hypothetical protein n=1 Tax=Planomonospora sp. ID91781 TaxID=2738135 RepID=UPI0018C3828A|nr:hypothetical protein [Planomonospora sp. ID91781]MBG0826160.1 hypothetical protein [Planomonospora sp. ID91781]